MTNSKLINFHGFGCRGIETEEQSESMRGDGGRGRQLPVLLPVLDQRDAEPVVILTYEDGSTLPLCRHFDVENGSCEAGKYYRRAKCPYKTESR